MRKKLKKLFVLLALLLLPFVTYADELPLKEAHKPPILTTTAIIEVHEAWSI